MIIKAKEDHYAILEIEVNSHIYEVQPTVIKKAYRKLALLYHPDKRQAGSDVIFKKLNKSYEVLINEETKNEYDQWYKKYYKRVIVTADLIAKEQKRKIKLEADELRRAKMEDVLNAQAEATQKKKDEEKKRKMEEKKKREEEVLRKRREEEQRKFAEKLKKQEEENLRAERRRQEELRRAREREEEKIKEQQRSSEQAKREKEYEALRQEALRKVDEQIRKKEELRKRAEELHDMFGDSKGTAATQSSTSTETPKSKQSSKTFTPTSKKTQSKSSTPRSAYFETRKNGNGENSRSSTPTPKPQPEPKTQSHTQPNPQGQQPQAQPQSTPFAHKAQGSPYVHGERSKASPRRFQRTKKESYKEEHLSKKDYFAKVNDFKSRALKYHELREQHAKESEELDARANILEKSARKALEKAQLKYRESISRADALAEKAQKFSEESNDAHYKMDQLLKLYEDLTARYGKIYGEEEDDTFDSREDGPPPASTNPTSTPNTEKISNDSNYKFSFNENAFPKMMSPEGASPWIFQFRDINSFKVRDPLEAYISQLKTDRNSGMLFTETFAQNHIYNLFKSGDNIPHSFHRYCTERLSLERTDQHIQKEEIEMMQTSWRFGVDDYLELNKD